MRQKGLSIIVVSSGAVGLGMGRLGKKRRPKDVTTQQVCAAVEQSLLTEVWQQGLAPFGVNVAQLLLTRDDLRLRKRHVAVKDSLDKILSHGIIPVINENDAISADELKFGDNDVLAALVASLTKAQLLVLLSSAPGLVDMNSGDMIIPVVHKITPEIESLARGTTDVTATGGMVSKLQAAKIAMQSGCGVFIASGLKEAPIQHLLGGEPEGTFFVPAKQSLESKKRWIAFFEHPEGVVSVDAGASEALLKKRASLLAKGIVSVSGDFDRGAIIGIQSAEGILFGRGVAEFSSQQIEMIRGCRSDVIQAKIPGRKKFEVIHRDFLVTWEV